MHACGGSCFFVRLVLLGVAFLALSALLLCLSLSQPQPVESKTMQLHRSGEDLSCIRPFYCFFFRQRQSGDPWAICCRFWRAFCCLVRFPCVASGHFGLYAVGCCLVHVVYVVLCFRESWAICYRLLSVLLCAFRLPDEWALVGSGRFEFLMALRVLNSLTSVLLRSLFYDLILLCL